MFDIDGNKAIDKIEFEQIVLTLSPYENIDKQKLFNEYDVDHNNIITYDEFKELCKKYPQLTQQYNTLQHNILFNNIIKDVWKE